MGVRFFTWGGLRGGGFNGLFSGCTGASGVVGVVELGVKESLGV